MVEFRSRHHMQKNETHETRITRRSRRPRTLYKYYIYTYYTHIYIYDFKLPQSPGRQNTQMGLLMLFLCPACISILRARLLSVCVCPFHYQC